MEKIGLSKFKANCVKIVERVARTGEPVTITQKGAPIARLVSPHSHHADQAKLDPVAATLDLDEDVIDADELIEAEQVTGQWDDLNSAIARDVGAAPKKHPKSKPLPQIKPAAKIAGQRRRPKA
jgi:prevent-host-death family protein